MLAWLARSSITAALFTAAPSASPSPRSATLAGLARLAAAVGPPQPSAHPQQQQQQQALMTTGHCRPLPAPCQQHQQEQQTQPRAPPLMRVLTGSGGGRHQQDGANSRGSGRAAAASPSPSSADVSMRGHAALTARSSSSSGGDQHRASPGGGPKTAKRKAAEALLAAQYGGGLGSDAASSGGSSSPLADVRCRLFASLPKGAVAAAAAGDGGGSSDSESDRPAPHSLVAAQQRSSVAGAILKLGGSAAPAPSLAAAAAAATARSVRPRLSAQPLASGQLLAATEVLELTAVSEDAALAATAPRQSQQSVQVPACDEGCGHSLSHGWCHSQVRLPHVDWGRVMAYDMAVAPSFRVASGYEKLMLPGGVQVLVVEQQAQLGAALELLRGSMLDDVVAIDLEWRPQFGKGFTPVAMVQLATSTTAVLVRTCRMGYKLPPVLRSFLQDGGVHLIGFSWAAADEGKMQSTFGLGHRDFGRFSDLQRVAQGLGYHSFGLARLARQVLGFAMPKSKRVSMSNWEAAALNRSQVKYAALDVLVAGQVFRALRLWHASPSVCEVCHYTLGAAAAEGGTCGALACGDCGKVFSGVRDYLGHCQRTGHAARWAECEGCGCARQLPWPSGRTPSQLAGWQQSSAAAAAPEGDGQ